MLVLLMIEAVRCFFMCGTASVQVVAQLRTREKILQHRGTVPCDGR